MAKDTLHELFLDHLQDIYYAEKTILKALPKMEKKAASPALRTAFETHRTQTEGQVERLEQVFEAIGAPPKAKTCEALNGIVEEAEELMKDFAEGAALDAGLAAGGQAVEHYEIARYGTLIAWAKAMGHNEAVSLLEANLAEEKQTDALLNKLANENLNKQAKQAA